MKFIVLQIVKSLEAITKYLKQDNWQHIEDRNYVPAVIIEEGMASSIDNDTDREYKGKPVGITQEALDRHKANYERKLR